MYEFAHNKTKLNRALVICGSSPTEECVRAEYTKMGGLVIGPVESTAEIAVEVEVVEEPKKNKKAK